MPTRPCPDCRATAPRFLPGSSAYSWVNYYRCDACGHVFSIDVNDPNGPCRDVTVGRRPPDGNCGGGNSATS